MNQIDKKPVAKISQATSNAVIQKRKKAAYGWKELSNQEARDLLNELAQDNTDKKGHIAHNANESLKELQAKIDQENKDKNFFKKMIHLLKNCP